MWFNSGLFKGKRIPPTKTRPLRQGSKKSPLDEDPRATEKILAGAVPDESKRPGRAGGGWQGSGAVPLLPHLAQKGTVSFEGNFLGPKQPSSDCWAEELPKPPPPVRAEPRRSARPSTQGSVSSSASLASPRLILRPRGGREAPSPEVRA